ncbi:hypothetical protein P8A21_40505 (plasmid) [Streptomyces poriferorum]|uniref:hypothetical protein n=1 Tax=Streptomyces poriferorum TaxID=2798799 RepID=UPI00273EF85A|nr:hypothetical protein [Streptomyces sp. Alt1]WLQ53808.1 hypothetical protein P8A21_40505 [Streptomyces sp. Alt1]
MTLTIKAQTIARGWWPDVDTADQKLTSWIRERGSRGTVSAIEFQLYPAAPLHSVLGMTLLFSPRGEFPSPLPDQYTPTDALGLPSAAVTKTSDT